MVAALKASGRGARVISAGIHMSEIPAFSYDLLWEERTLGSVANLTRADGEDLLRVAPEVPVRAKVTTYALEDAQRALEDARAGQDRGLRRPRRLRVRSQFAPATGNSNA